MALLSSVIQRGTLAARPAATAVGAGTLYYDTTNSILYRSSGSAWENVESNGLANPMTTNGDLITQAAGVPARIALGTANQVLTVTGGAPAWAAPAAATAGPAELLYLNRMCS